MTYNSGKRKSFLLRATETEDDPQPTPYYLGLAKGLAVLDLLLTILHEADGLDGNEASSIHVGEFLERVHGSIRLIVEVGSVAGPAWDIGVALVSGQHQSHCAGGRRWISQPRDP